MNAFLAPSSSSAAPLSTDDITDPSDWAETSLPSLESLDFTLRCQICKEFLTAPVLTTCGHSFCSLCIRRCIQAEEKCPVCRSNQLESGLRKNTVLEEAVLAFGRCRAGIMELATKKGPRNGERVDVGVQVELGESREVKRPRLERGREAAVKKENERTPSSSQEDEGRRRSTRNTRFTGSMSVRPSRSTTIEIKDSEDEISDGTPSPAPKRARDKSYEPEIEEPPPPIDDGLSECPVCGKRMPAEEISSTHLDACLSGTASSAPAPSQPSTPKNLFRTSQASPSKRPTNNKPLFFSSFASSSKNNEVPTRLPKINYPTLKENALRAKLTELGIPTYGAKPVLQARHTEWVMLVNANADAKFPKTKGELLKELNEWERTRGKAVGEKKEKEDFKADEWVKNNKSQYDALLENARKRRKVAPKPEEKTEEPQQEVGERMDLDVNSSAAPVEESAFELPPSSQQLLPEVNKSNYAPEYDRVPSAWYPGKYVGEMTEGMPVSDDPFLSRGSYQNQGQTPELSQEVVHR